MAKRVWKINFLLAAIISALPQLKIKPMPAHIKSINATPAIEIKINLPTLCITLKISQKVQLPLSMHPRPTSSIKEKACASATGIKKPASKNNNIKNKNNFFIINHYKLQTTNYQLPTTNYKLPTTNYKLQTTNYKLQTTN